MYYVYFIKSLIKQWVYVGNTEFLERRLVEHNNGEVKSTKFYRPFRLIFVQEVETRKEARDLEKFYKIRWNKESLLNLIN